MTIKADETMASAGVNATDPMNSRTALGCFLFDTVGDRLTVSHSRAPQRILWALGGTLTPVRAGVGHAQVTESRGFFQVTDDCGPLISGGAFDNIKTNDTQVVVTGPLGEQHRWTLEFTALSEDQLGLRLSTSDPKVNRLHLVGHMPKDHKIFGFGEQFTHLDMKGRRVPILSQEPGIGRGVQPLTWLMNTTYPRWIVKQWAALAPVCPRSRCP